MDTTSLPSIVLETEEVLESEEESNADFEENECAQPQDSQDSLDDDGWETDIEIKEPPKTYDPSGRRVYVSACFYNGVTPVSFFIKHIQDKTMRLRHHSLGSKSTKAIAIALVTNTSIVNLDLHDNYLGDEGAKAISDMLKENCFILNCDLSSNKIGFIGCSAICDMLQNSGNITTLNLSNNLLGDKEALLISDAIKGNDNLHNLNLSHNHFSEVGGQAIGPSIASNDAIEHLDLSWNHIRRRGAVAVALGLKTNCTLKVLDLSWNGLADEGATALCDALKGNNTLTELNIRNNRISSTGATLIAKGLEGNNTLEIIKIGQNPIQTVGANSILSAIRNRADSSIHELDLEGIYLDEEFYILLKSLNERKPLKIVGKPRPTQRTPLDEVKNFITNNYDRWMEEFEAFDSDGSGLISQEHFLKGMKKFEISFEKAELVWLCISLTEGKETKISYRTPFLGLKKKPVTASKPPSEGSNKSAKGKKGKKKK